METLLYEHAQIMKHVEGLPFETATSRQVTFLIKIGLIWTYYPKVTDSHRIHPVERAQPF